MHFGFSHRLAAAAAIVTLSACAGQGVVPSSTAALPLSPAAAMTDATGLQSFVPGVPVRSDRSIDGTTSPCDFSSEFWYFGGSCKAVTPAAAGTRVKLASFDGYAVNVVMPSSKNVTSAAQFIVGDGTTDKNITGTLRGKRFPLFGAKGYGCYNVLNTKQEPCKGKGSVYVLMYNNGTKNVTFSGTPGFAIRSSSFPGATCRFDELLYDKAGAPSGWGLTPLTAAVKNGRITIRSVKENVNFEKGLAYIFGFSCY